MRGVIVLLMLSAVLGTTALAASGNAGNIAGVWRTKSGGYLQIYRDGQNFVGTIVGSVSGKPRYDTENPDAAKRGRRLLGVTILKGLSYQGDHEYTGGRIYDPNNGKTYKTKATLKGPDTLDVRGYIGFSLFGRTQTWRRVDPKKAPNVHQKILHQPLGAAPHSSP